MTSGFFAIFTTALCTLFFTVPDVQSILASEFDRFNGERICTDGNTSYQPATYCRRINNQSTTDCTSLNLLMTSETNEVDLYSREVVACRVNNIIVACVSGGRTDEYYLVWAYFYPDPSTASVPERCLHPQERKIPNATAGKGKSKNAGEGTSTNVEAE